MKRKLSIAAILVGLAAAIVLIVLAAQQPADNRSSRGGFILTTNGQLVMQPRDGYAVPTIIAHLPKTNSASAPAHTK